MWRPHFSQLSQKECWFRSHLSRLWHFEQRLLEDAQLPVDPLALLELDEHRPEPAGAPVDVERLARLLERAADALRAKLEQHRLEEHLGGGGG